MTQHIREFAGMRVQSRGPLPIEDLILEELVLIDDEKKVGKYILCNPPFEKISITR